MAQCLFRTFVLVTLAIALLAPSPSRAGDKALRDTIAFASMRDNPTASFATAIEIYLMNPDGTDQRRLTHNDESERTSRERQLSDFTKVVA